MNKIIFFLLLSCFICPIVQAQIPIPYYQPFESYEEFRDGHWNDATLDHCCKPESCPPKDGVDRLKINDKYNYKGNALRILVRENDTVYMHSKENDPRSRAEIEIEPDHGEGSTYYYSWRVFIPKDSFPDQIPSGNPFHIIAQWHQDGNKVKCAGTQPPFKLKYKHEVDATDDLRNLTIWYGVVRSQSCAPVQERQFLIQDAITKGEWNHIVTKIHWTASEEDGFMQLWINGKPCVKEIDAAGNVDWLLKSEAIENATKIYGANLYINGNSNPVPNYLHIGHYRGYHTGFHTLYIDDFRISREFPPLPNRTKLLEANCGGVLNGDYVSCYALSNVSFYKYRFYDGTNYHHINDPSNTVSLDRHWIEPNTTYHVQVRGMFDESNGFNYGETCTITTPHITELTNEYCGKTLIGDYNISCNKILGINYYKFRFYDGTNYHYINDPSNTVSLDRHWAKPNTTYQVQVRAMFDEDNGFNYGEVCTVTTPHITELTNEYCDKTLTGNYISCNEILGINYYKFRFYDGTNYHYINDPSNTVSLDRHWVKSNTTYQVQVRAMYDEDNGFNYGEVCTVTTPSQFPINNNSRIGNGEFHYREDSMNKGFKVKFSNPLAENRNIKIYNDSEANAHLYIYAINGQLMYQKNLIDDYNLNLDHFGSGVYLMKIISVNKTYTEKLIVY